MSEQVNPPRQERRRNRRFSCVGEAHVISVSPRTLFRGKVRDISRTGCFIETRAQIDVEGMAEVELHFIARGIRLKSLARLTDVRPGKGAGFEFVPGDPRMEGEFALLIDSLNAADKR
ncbi:MAG TPA: PilZ domain-containing protein [Terracidiphilus sp.]|jgi:hypothetical protein